MIRRAVALASVLAALPMAARSAPAAITLWPVENGQVLSGFAGKHQGIDIAAPPGTPVRAFAAGIVTARDRNKHCGEYLELKHADGTSSRYCNLANVTVRDGDRIEAGTPLGEIAVAPAGGKAHLHFELKRDAGKVDPMTRLPRSPA